MLSDSDSSDPSVSTDLILAKIQHLSSEELADLQKTIVHALEQRKGAVSPKRRVVSAHDSETVESCRQLPATEESRAVEEVKELLKPLIQRLKAAKGKNDRYMWWFPLIGKQS